MDGTMDAIMANLIAGWLPEPRDKTEYWLWLAEQVMRPEEVAT